MATRTSDWRKQVRKSAAPYDIDNRSSKQVNPVLHHMFNVSLAIELYVREMITPDDLFNRLLNHLESQAQRFAAKDEHRVMPDTLLNAKKKTSDQVVLMAYFLDRWCRERGNRKNEETLKNGVFANEPEIQSVIGKLCTISKKYRTEWTKCSGHPQLEIKKADGKLFAFCRGCKNNCYYQDLNFVGEDCKSLLDTEECKQMDETDSSLVPQEIPESTDQETPMYSEDDRKDKMKHLDPITLSRRQRDEKEKASHFAKKIVLVIHTCNKNEYWAAVELMKPPTTDDDKPIADRPVIYPKVNYVIGWFAEYRAAIVMTDQGAKCQDPLMIALREIYPNGQVVIGAGIAYSNDRKRKFADVLVSNQIENFVQYKAIGGGDLECQGTREPIDRDIIRIFKDSAKNWEDIRPFTCAEPSSRASVAHVGCIVSAPALVKDEILRNQLMKNTPTAIGGEMEGWALLELKKSLKSQHNKDISVIVIKGVADYGDTNKGDQWQWTAARAAMNCIHYCLEKTGGTEFNAEKIELGAATLPVQNSNN